MQNNEKILNILQLKSDITNEAKDYLNQLQTRYEWSQDARSSFYSARRTINEVTHELNILSRRLSRNSDRYEQYIQRIKNEAERLNSKYSDMYNKEEPYLSELSILALNSIIDDGYVEEASAYLQRNLSTLGVRKLQNLLATLSEIGVPNLEKIEIINTNTAFLDAIINNEMTGYKQFFKENVSQFDSDISTVINNLNSIELDGYSEQLNQAKTSLNIVKEPTRPIGDTLMDLLDQMDASDAKLTEGYTAPEFAEPVYDSVRYLKRALREDREFKGTESALERFENAVDLLDTYYHTFYWQAGGTPRNNHGRTAKLN